MKTITDSALAKLTHAVGPDSAARLAARISALEAAGFVVLSARSGRNAVPTCYRSAYKVAAPYYEFRPDSRELVLVSAPLETRPHGRPIPPVLEVAGAVVPTGYRCFRRAADRLEIRPA